MHTAGARDVVAASERLTDKVTHLTSVTASAPRIAADEFRFDHRTLEELASRLAEKLAPVIGTASDGSSETGAAHAAVETVLTDASKRIVRPRDDDRLHISGSVLHPQQPPGTAPDVVQPGHSRRPTADKRLLSLAEAARRIGVSRNRTMHALIASGDIHAIKVGKRWRIASAELDRFEREAGTVKALRPSPVRKEITQAARRDRAPLGADLAAGIRAMKPRATGGF